MESDQRYWVLPPEVYDQFLEDLDVVRDDLPKLEKLFAKPTPFIDCE
jgi:hypothetical protein